MLKFLIDNIFVNLDGRVFDRQSAWVLHVSLFSRNRIGDVMVSMHTSSAVDREFEFRFGQTKDYKINFVASPLTALRSKDKD